MTDKEAIEKWKEDCGYEFVVIRTCGQCKHWYCKTLEDEIDGGGRRHMDCSAYHSGVCSLDARSIEINSACTCNNWKKK